MKDSTKDLLTTIGAFAAIGVGGVLALALSLALPGAVIGYIAGVAWRVFKFVAGVA